MDYSIPLNGISSACQYMQQTAQHFTKPDPATDFAADLVSIRQAKTAVQANLKVVSIEQNLENSLLDIFA